MHITSTVSAPVHSSFRVAQVCGMFDLPPAKVQSETFDVELPSLDEPWRIGAIIGPSGSGKSTVARAAFGDCVYAGSDWPRDRALIDGFGDAPIKQITQTLTAVGLGSPPSWLKPYYALSTGEKFRADLARALLGCRLSAVGCRPESMDALADSREPRADSLVVFDEFTSVVDRTVARVASAAVARAIRGGHIPVRLVVVSCHSDILPWLAPDWHLDMAAGRLARDCLQRPPIALRVVAARHAAWKLFARHHYLSGQLARGASVYVALLCSPPFEGGAGGGCGPSATPTPSDSPWGKGENQVPVALCATIALYGHAGRRRIHRLVTLPDFQGVGIGARLLDFVAEKTYRQGQRVNITTSHPAIISHCRRSPRWRAVDVQRTGGARQQKDGARIKSSRGRATMSFEFRGEGRGTR